MTGGPRSGRLSVEAGARRDAVEVELFGVIGLEHRLALLRLRLVQAMRRCQSVESVLGPGVDEVDALLELCAAQRQVMAARWRAGAGDKWSVGEEG